MQRNTQIKVRSPRSQTEWAAISRLKEAIRLTKGNRDTTIAISARIRSATDHLNDLVAMRTESNAYARTAFAALSDTTMALTLIYIQKIEKRIPDITSYPPAYGGLVKQGFAHRQAAVDLTLSLHLEALRILLVRESLPASEHASIEEAYAHAYAAYTNLSVIEQLDCIEAFAFKAGIVRANNQESVWSPVIYEPGN